MGRGSVREPISSESVAKVLSSTALLVQTSFSHETLFCVASNVHVLLSVAVLVVLLVAVIVVVLVVVCRSRLSLSAICNDPIGSLSSVSCDQFSVVEADAVWFRNFIGRKKGLTNEGRTPGITDSGILSASQPVTLQLASLFGKSFLGNSVLGESSL